MKFAEDLTENLVPEWKDKYLDYKVGKKKIKQITNSPNFITKTFANTPFTKSRSQSTPGLDDFSSLPPAAIDIEHSASFSAKDSVDARKYDDRTPLLQSAQRAVVDDDSILTRRNTIKNAAYQSHSPVPLQTFSNSTKQEFIDWLDSELEKIEIFYKENEDHDVQRFLLLQDQLYHLRADKLKNKAQSEREELIQKSLHQTTYKLNKYELPSFPDFKFGKNTVEHSSHLQDYEHHTQKIPYYIAKRQLKAAVQEFYRGLELLKNYRMLNRTAFRKLCKKFDKKTSSSISESYMTKVNSSHFASSDILDNLLPKVEDIYGSIFEHGNRKIAIEKLRSNLHDELFYTSTFLAGLFYGLSVPLLLYALYLGVKTMEDSVSQETKFILQIWAGFFLILLMALFFGIDCYIWSKFKVNYKFIFEFNQKDCLNSKQIHLIPSFFFFGLGLFSWFSFNDFWPNIIPSRDWPWFFFAFALFVMFMPFNIFYLNSRRWLIIVMWRLIFSGFYPVEFKDFFLGDIFCSLTYTMGNLSFFFCVYATHWAGADVGDPVCGSSRSRLMGFFSALPSVWRCLQCLRRYSDSGDWFPHLANMLKYSIAIGYYAMLSCYRIDRSETNRGIFIMIATANSVICGIWDILMDWSLMQDTTLLRSTLTFPRSAYYAAITANIILRFQWIFYALFSQQIQQSAMTSFFVAIAEIIRRFIWLVIRMENEHIANIHSYRASREVRLPYETIIRDGSSMMSRNPSNMNPNDQESNIGFERIQTGASTHIEDNAIKRRGTILNSSVFQNVSKAIVNAHAKDFQRRKNPSDDQTMGNNSSDEDNSDDESTMTRDQIKK